MDYLDTSVIVSALCNEAATPFVQQWLAARPVGNLAVSDWTITEVSSALAIKLRRGDISGSQRAIALGAFNALISRSVTVLPVDARNFRAAAAFADRHEFGLRAGDALHLAVASGHGAVLWTLDRGLEAGGLAFGTAVQRVPLGP